MAFRHGRKATPSDLHSPHSIASPGQTDIPTTAAAGRPRKMEHANHLEQRLEQHGPDEARVALSLTGDLFLRSYHWAQWQLQIPLPPD